MEGSDEMIGFQSNQANKDMSFLIRESVVVGVWTILVWDASRYDLTRCGYAFILSSCKSIVTVPLVSCPDRCLIDACLEKMA